MTGILHEAQYAFMIICRSFIRKMKNVSDKSCTENQNVQITLNTFFSKTLPFMRKCGNIL
jgi:hypothetical protein